MRLTQSVKQRREGGKAGLKYQVVIGRQTSKLVGFALSLRGRYRAMAPPECRWIAEFARTLRKSPAEVRGPTGQARLCRLLSTVEYSSPRSSCQQVDELRDNSQGSSFIQPSSRDSSQGKCWWEAASSGRTRAGSSWEASESLRWDETFRSQPHRVSALRLGRKYGGERPCSRRHQTGRD